ncbi:hypothetical protein [Rhizobium sp. ZW T2_16]
MAMSCKRCNDERGDTDWLHKTFRRSEYTEYRAIECSR